MAHYGEKDPGVNKGIDETAAAMKKHNKIYDYKIYSGAQHAFNNDATRSGTTLKQHRKPGRARWIS